LPGLGGNVFTYYIPGLRIKRNLSRSKDHVAMSDCLAVWTDGGRRLVSLDLLTH